MLDEYGGRIRPETSRMARNALNAGEWALALGELALAIANARVPMTPEDARTTRYLLFRVPLPPEIPKDIADEFEVIDE